MENDNSFSVNIVNNASPSYYPNLNQSWLLLVLFIVFSFAAGIFLSLFGTFKNNNIQAWITLSSSILTYILLFYFINLRFKERRLPFTINWGKPPVIVIFLLLVITPLLSIVYEPISSLIPAPEWFSKAMESALNISIPSFISVVIIAPVFEEVLCRGIILEGLLKNKLKPQHAILWSALIFAVMHLNPWQGVYAFIIGCLMGWVYYKTRSLWTTILVHFINNGLSFLVLALITGKYANPTSVTFKEILGENNYLPVYFGALAILAISLFALYWYFKRMDNKNLSQPDIN